MLYAIESDDMTQDEVRELQPGDTAVVQGVNHAWANKSSKPCMIIGVMVHAHPWPADKDAAPGCNR